MTRSKWEDMIDEANAKSKLEDLTPDARLQVDAVNKRIAELRGTLKWHSNFYLLFMVFAIFMLYIVVVQQDYILAIFDAAFFIFSTYNFAESYTLIRIYSGKLKIEKIEVKNV